MAILGSINNLLQGTMFSRTKLRILHVTLQVRSLIKGFKNRRGVMNKGHGQKAAFRCSGSSVTAVHFQGVTFRVIQGSMVTPVV